MGGRQRLACVMGSMDLVRPLGKAGIPCVPVGAPGSEPLYSRFATRAISFSAFWTDEAGLLETLLRFGETCPVEPVLFFEEDSQLLSVSRNRDRLSPVFRFTLADAALVEDLVDKGRFQMLAERLRLPVPPTRRLRAGMDLEPATFEIHFPAILKPLTRRDTWDAVGGAAKAIELPGPDDLRRLWPSLIGSGMDLLLQEMIPGPESRIESYHVYVDAGGGIVAEFTGRKIRTYPVSCGHSTSLTITAEKDVLALGRSLVETLGLQGVAKFDFKRGPDGRLYLLEVNPRFNLWHHLGAVAGVNIPATVYADLDGSTRPILTTPRAGTTWCKLSNDRRSARDSGVSLSSWLSFALACEARSVVSLDDPMPYLRSKLYRRFGAHRHEAPHDGEAPKPAT